MKLFMALFFTISVTYAQKVTLSKNGKAVIRLNDIDMEEGETYELKNQNGEDVEVEVKKIRNGKALVKVLSGEISKGDTLSGDEVSSSDSESEDEDDDYEYEEEKPTEEEKKNFKSLYLSTKRHVLHMGLNYGSFEAFNALDANTAQPSLGVDLGGSPGINLGYQFMIIPYLSIGAMYRYFVGSIEYTTFTPTQSTSVSGNAGLLELVISAHFKNFYVRLGYAPMTDLEGSEGDDTLTFEGSGTELAVGYYHFFDIKFGLGIELFNASVTYDELEAATNGTTTFSGKLAYEVDQDITGFSINFIARL